jgi:LuxR family transcriptional regulator, transcriptional regulator of spore coat protein
MRYEEEVQLTVRERDVLHLVAQGRSAKETAIELSIAPCTVERHVENVRLKTRTRNRAHMIAHVIRTGLLPFESLDTSTSLPA